MDTSNHRTLVPWSLLLPSLLLWVISASASFRSLSLSLFRWCSVQAVSLFNCVSSECFFLRLYYTRNTCTIRGVTRANMDLTIVPLSLSLSLSLSLADKANLTYGSFGPRERERERQWERNKSGWVKCPLFNCLWDEHLYHLSICRQLTLGQLVHSLSSNLPGPIEISGWWQWVHLHGTFKLHRWHCITRDDDTCHLVTMSTGSIKLTRSTHMDTWFVRWSVLWHVSTFVLPQFAGPLTRTNRLVRREREEHFGHFSSHLTIVGFFFQLSRPQLFKSLDWVSFTLPTAVCQLPERQVCPLSVPLPGQWSISETKRGHSTRRRARLRVF